MSLQFNRNVHNLKLDGQLRNSAGDLIDLSNLAHLSDIPDLSIYKTQAENDALYASLADLEAKQDESQVQGLITSALAEYTTTGQVNAIVAVNAGMQIATALEDYTPTAGLDAVISSAVSDALSSYSDTAAVGSAIETALQDYPAAHQIVQAVNQMEQVAERHTGNDIPINVYSLAVNLNSSYFLKVRVIARDEKLTDSSLAFDKHLFVHKKSSDGSLVISDFEGTEMRYGNDSANWSVTASASGSDTVSIILTGLPDYDIHWRTFIRCDELVN